MVSGAVLAANKNPQRHHRTNVRLNPKDRRMDLRSYRRSMHALSRATFEFVGATLVVARISALKLIVWFFLIADG